MTIAKRVANKPPNLDTGKAPLLLKEKEAAKREAKLAEMEAAQAAAQETPAEVEVIGEKTEENQETE